MRRSGFVLLAAVTFALVSLIPVAAPVTVAGITVWGVGTACAQQENPEFCESIIGQTESCPDDETIDGGGGSGGGSGTTYPAAGGEGGQYQRPTPNCDETAFFYWCNLCAYYESIGAPTAGDACDRCGVHVEFCTSTP